MFDKQIKKILDENQALCLEAINQRIDQYTQAPDITGLFRLNINNGASPKQEIRYLQLAQKLKINQREGCREILAQICKAYVPISLPLISLYFGYTDPISVNTLCGLTACLNLSHQNEIHSLKAETKALNKTINTMTEIITRSQNEQNISSNNTNLHQMNHNQMNDSWQKRVASKRDESHNNISLI